MMFKAGTAKVSIVTHASMIYDLAARRFCLRAERLDDRAQYDAADVAERSRIDAQPLDTSLAAVLTANI